MITAIYYVDIAVSINRNAKIKVSSIGPSQFSAGRKPTVATETTLAPAGKSSYQLSTQFSGM
jgi:hypothetical protein